MASHDHTSTVFSYTDYRKYLEEQIPLLLQSKKWSWRALARETGYSSPNYLQQVISGYRHLHPRYIKSTALTMGLDEDGAKYFETLLRFSEARTHEERDQIFREILQQRKRRKIRTLDSAQYAFFSQWWIPVVWEVMVHPECPGTAEWISKKIRPSISISQAEKAFLTLEELDLVEKSSDGKWLRREHVLQTTPEIRSIGAVNYHRQALELASQAVEKSPSDERDFRSVTIGLSKREIDLIKDQLSEFWNRVLAEAEDSEHKDKVYQLQMQFYPVTLPLREENE
jgi:uncharacterized protein (TIGR02147 family)